MSPYSFEDIQQIRRNIDNTETSELIKMAKIEAILMRKAANAWYRRKRKQTQLIESAKNLDNEAELLEQEFKEHPNEDCPFLWKARQKLVEWFYVVSIGGHMHIGSIEAHRGDPRWACNCNGLSGRS